MVSTLLWILVMAIALLIFSVYYYPKFSQLSPPKLSQSANNKWIADKNLQQQVCFTKDLGYKDTPWSILDAVPPPDPFHVYKSDRFKAEQINMTDFDRWKAEWQPNENYSIKYLDLSNNFYI